MMRICPSVGGVTIQGYADRAPSVDRRPSRLEWEAGVVASEQLSAKAVVSKFIECINLGDIDGLSALMTDDHTLQVLDEGPLVGRLANGSSESGLRASTVGASAVGRSSRMTRRAAGSWVSVNDVRVG